MAASSSPTRGEPAPAHTHALSAGSERRVFWAMGLTGAFMLAELAGGVWSGSLALLSDAGHMVTDFVSLALAWSAFRLSRRRPSLRRSYGYHRFQVLAAFANGLALAFIALWICVEALRRFADPVEVRARAMFAIAATGLLVNLVCLAILRSGDSQNLNVRGTALHVLGDVLGSVAAIAAALVILRTGWTPIDPLLSMLVVVLIARAAWQVLRDSGHILLEGTPENVDPAELRRQIEAAIPRVAQVHHVHIWSLTSERPVVTLHAVLDPGADHDETLRRIHRALEETFGVSHATIQLEHGRCPDEAAG
jgi:cobalt-zinc-cadmium efflux system protein